jgi:hypothetical protein
MVEGVGISEITLPLSQAGPHPNPRRTLPKQLDELEAMVIHLPP